MIEKRLALVTGASRGIGHAILFELARSGATVVGTATSEEGAKSITEALQSHGFIGTGVVMNITAQESIDGAMSQIGDAFGMPSILVNNAGVTADNLFLRMNDTQWEKAIDTNLTGVFRVTRACIKAMVKARWGPIINISSVVGATGNPGQTNYSAAKAGVIAFSKSLALEIATRGITVNCVAPGYIETDMTGALTQAQAEQIKSKIPVGSIGQPQDVADAVAFLASPRAGYITGETLHVNGGMFMG